MREIQKSRDVNRIESISIASFDLSFCCKICKWRSARTIMVLVFRWILGMQSIQITPSVSWEGISSSSKQKQHISESFLSFYLKLSLALALFLIIIIFIWHQLNNNNNNSINNNKPTQDNNKNNNNGILRGKHTSHGLTAHRVSPSK